jgi:hypothetical protein
MIIVLDRKITPKEFEHAREAYSDYIKVVIDVKRDILAIGGEFHIDCEEVLIKSGSSSEDLFGGGFRVSTKEIEYMALSNYKPAFGKVTYEIADESIRKKLKELTEKFLMI